MSQQPNSQDHLYDKVQLAGPGIDPDTGAAVTSSDFTRMVHDGEVFHMSAKLSGLLTASTTRLLLSIPLGTEMHLVRVRANMGAGDIDLNAFEDVITSADGTPIVSRNLNRSSIITPDCDMFASPTVTTPGTEIHSLWLPPQAAGVGQSLSGMATDDAAGEEWVLKPNTKYSWNMTNNSGATIDAWFEFLWYERAVT